MLGLFRSGKSAWHQAITRTAADNHPITITTEAPTPNSNFPWLKLQEHTEDYVRKKRKLTPEQLELRFVEYIRANTYQFDIAIAACGHRLRPEVLRSLLSSDLNISVRLNLSMTTYLQAIIAANRVNPRSVGDVEAQRASSMIAAEIIGASSPGQYLNELVKILVAGVPPTFILYTHLHALALRACSNFAAQLQNLKDEGHLRRAHSAASWLSGLIESSLEAAPENLGPEKLLDVAFPAWRSWARWNPNKERLINWERFSNEEKVALKSLIALEGPDFVSRRNTMWEGVMARGPITASSPVDIGGIVVEPRLAADIERTVRRLLLVMDDAAKVDSTNVGILIHECVGKTIFELNLHTPEVIGACGDSTIGPLVLTAYGVGNPPRSFQMTATMRLLSFLSDDKRQDLRDITFPSLVPLIEASIKDMQNWLKTQLDSGNVVDNADATLQAFGNALLDNVWILPLLDHEVLALLGEWPSKVEIATLHKLRVSLQTADPKLKAGLQKKVNDFCKDCLIARDTIDKSEKRLVGALVSVWDEPPTDDLHDVALYVAHLSEIDTKILCRCLSLLTLLPGSFLKNLWPIMKNFEKEPDLTCVRLAKLLAHIPFSSTDASSPWRLILYGILEDRNKWSLESNLNRLNTVEWISHLSDLKSVFPSLDPWNEPPRMLQAALLDWGHRIQKYQSTLTSLEQALVGHEPVIKTFLRGGEGAFANQLANILRSFQKAAQTPNLSSQKSAMLTILKLLTPQNSQAISKVTGHLLKSSKEGVDAFLRVLDLHHGKSTTLVAEAMLASWVQSSDMHELDRNLLRALAEMLGLDTSSKTSTPVATLEAAADYLDAQFAALFVEAKRLDALRAGYNRVDPNGTTKLLSALNIENPSSADDLLADVPSSIRGCVEMVEDETVEIQFPLELTPLQQMAMGVGNARNLTLRLTLTEPPKFCLHLDNEKQSFVSAGGHIPWDMSEKLARDHPPCHGRPTRTTYQLTRILGKHLQNGFKSLEKVHSLVTTALKDLTTSCLICGQTKGTHLQRSATCQVKCSSIFYQATIEVRLAEIRNDPPAMDLLLTMVHYAAASHKMELLPECPLPATTNVVSALKKVPNLSRLTNVSDLSASIHKLGNPTETLLSWACLHYGGFLVSATGSMRIPGWPANTHQFLLANANPTLEADFRSQMGTLPTRVLWHGTSMERLYAILSQGLKICSNTALQAHGAASGPGIYTADNPHTSWSYATTAGPNWSGSSFSNVRVLLGLEASGPVVGSGIHVVTNPSSLIVRYVFLVPAAATIPAATIVEPAMLSVYRSLRSGAL